MLNQLTSQWTDKPSAENRWPDMDRDPQIRLILLWLAMCAPMLFIVGRVVQLQLYLKQDFAEAFSRTTETYEDIPTRDGRIFAADRSTVLAGDILRYDVAVYYPAIESPADDAWITVKAKPRLNKADRRNKARLEEEKQKVIEENEYLWTRLAALTNRPLNELTEARQRERDRVQRIKESVNRRHRERQAEAERREEEALAHAATFWNGLCLRVQRAFSEPPSRNRGPRLITEELEYCTVITDISEDMKLEIESNPEKFPYTRVLVHTRRTYPEGELAAHLIGARKPLTDEQLQKRKQRFHQGDPQDYRVGDPCGLFGLERYYDLTLKGVRARRLIVKNLREEIIETRMVREPRHGRDLVLTLDSELQRHAEQLLDKALKRVTLQGSTDPEASHGIHTDATCPQGGCIVAMDIYTGAILVAAAAPRYDLNLYVTPDTELWDDVISDKRSPLFSRVNEMALPPGSVFKVISAVAAIESGKMPPEETFFCRGYLDRPDKQRCMQFRHFHVGHNEVTLTDALCRSCNVYFYTAARRMGPQYLVDWARKFGIGQPTGIDLPAESAGHLPAPDEASMAVGQNRRWKPVDTLELAIGQSKLEVTPLQMVRAVAAIANGGHLVVPHLAANVGVPAAIDTESSRPVLASAEGRQISGLHPGTLDYVREGMIKVVNDSRGTGYKTVRMKAVTIAGKTGTAETSGIDHAWFVGYAPAERPRIAFVVVLEHGGGGGKVAGPVAHDFVQALLERGLIEKSTELASDRARGSKSIE